MSQASQLKELLEKHPLMGVTEVCDALGIPSSNLSKWPGLPEPVQRIHATRLWLSDDIYEFLARREAKKKAKTVVG